jgi:hypothetical protein
MKTDTLIRLLAADAARPVIGIRPLLGAALAAGAASSVALFRSLLGARDDLAASLHDFDFVVKITVTTSLMLTAAVALDAAARPARRAAPLSLGFAPLLLAAAVILELATVPASDWLPLLVGQNAGLCLTAIPVLASLPALFLMLALKRGAPARPRLAAAIAGLAAGGLGASLYATFCPVDNPLFVATWYSIAIATVTGVCALCGRWLRW